MKDIDEYAVVYPSPRQETDGVNDLSMYSLMMRPEGTTDEMEIFEYPLTGEQARPLRNRYLDEDVAHDDDLFSFYDAVLDHSDNDVYAVTFEADDGWMMPPVLTLEEPLYGTGNNIETDIPTGIMLGLSRGAEIGIDESLFGPDSGMQDVAEEYFQVFSRGGHRFEPVRSFETRPDAKRLDTYDYTSANVFPLDEDTIDAYVEKTVEETEQQVVPTVNGQQVDPTAHPQIEEMVEQSISEVAENIRKSTELLMTHFRNVSADGTEYVLHAPVEHLDEAAVKNHYRHNGGIPDVTAEEVDRVRTHSAASLADELLGTADASYQLFIDAATPSVNDQISDAVEGAIEAVPTETHMRLGEEVYELPISWTPALLPTDNDVEVFFRYDTDLAEEYTLDPTAVSTDQQNESRTAQRMFQ